MTLTLFPCNGLSAYLSPQGCANLKRAYQTAPDRYPRLHPCGSCSGVEPHTPGSAEQPEPAIKNPAPFNHPGARPQKQVRSTQCPPKSQKRRQKGPTAEEPYNPYSDTPCPHCGGPSYGKSGVCFELLMKGLGK